MVWLRGRRETLPARGSLCVPVPPKREARGAPGTPATMLRPSTALGALTSTQAAPWLSALLSAQVPLVTAQGPGPLDNQGTTGQCLSSGVTEGPMVNTDPQRHWEQERAPMWCLPWSPGPMGSGPRSLHPRPQRTNPEFTRMEIYRSCCVCGSVRAETKQPVKTERTDTSK